MNQNRCFHCGGQTEEVGGLFVCRSCGAVMPDGVSPKEKAMLYSAFALLRESRFEEAKTAFEEIIRQYPYHPDAYFGRLRARYRIGYVPTADGKLVPRCPTRSGANIFDDVDYLTAMGYADEETKAFIRAQAETVKDVCADHTPSKNIINAFGFGEVDPKDAVSIPRKVRKKDVLISVLLVVAVLAATPGFLTGLLRYAPSRQQSVSGAVAQSNLIVTNALSSEGVVVPLCDDVDFAPTDDNIACAHADLDMDHHCDYCGVGLSVCADLDMDHYCDYCGEAVTECADYNKDHRCDLCGVPMTACTDINRDHKCDSCGATLTACEDNNNDHRCDLCGVPMTACTDINRDHKCDICGAALTACEDNNNDHNCDICGTVWSACLDNNVDHFCDICGLKLSDCTFGEWITTKEATADETGEQERICSLCGKTETEILDSLASETVTVAYVTPISSIQYWYFEKPTVPKVCEDWNNEDEDEQIPLAYAQTALQ